MVVGLILGSGLNVLKHVALGKKGKPENVTAQHHRMVEQNALANQPKPWTAITHPAVSPHHIMSGGFYI